MNTGTGGPAFPSNNTYSSGSAYEHEINHAGMTLRDYFAAAALQGTLAGRATWPATYEKKQTLVAECFVIADIMLAERAK